MLLIKSFFESLQFSFFFLCFSTQASAKRRCFRTHSFVSESLGSTDLPIAFRQESCSIRYYAHVALNQKNRVGTLFFFLRIILLIEIIWREIWLFTILITHYIIGFIYVLINGVVRLFFFKFG